MAQRVSEKMIQEEALVPTLGAVYLAPYLNGVLKGAWSHGHLSLGELWGHMTRYPYLPRLARRDVLDECVRHAPLAVLVGQERFALATGWDETTQRYRGLIIPPRSDASITPTDNTLFVEWDVAQAQAEAEATEAVPATQDSSLTSEPSSPVRVLTPSEPPMETEEEDGFIRFFGAVTLNPDRYSRDLGNIQREIIDYLAGAGATLEISLDIQARKADGFTEAEIRTITENARTLKFDNSAMGFSA